MTYFLFIGDLLVMAFMFCLVTWLSLRSSKEKLHSVADLPLHDEQQEGGTQHDC